MKRAVVLFLIIVAGCAPMPEQKKDIDLSQYKTAVFAGGCFWCVEKAFEQVDGVVEVISGYAGGDVEDPSYEQVSSQSTGHKEAIQVYYDKSKVSYRELLDVFWRNIDPTDSGGQFVDRGESYTTAIFYQADEERQMAEQSKAGIQEHFDEPVVTPIVPLNKFYPAEEYHQDYYEKHPIKYKYYYQRSGRPDFFEEAWSGTQAKGMPSKEELKKQLTPLQYEVTQEDGTEPAFNNEYWNETRDGIYVDIISGEPLFSSKDKYKSGTGWPSFTKPIDEDAIVIKKDYKLVYPRNDVRGAKSGAHIGHVFDDGPEPTGKRWCMNSAALKFIPKEELEKEGYGEYLKLFE